VWFLFSAQSKSGDLAEAGSRESPALPGSEQRSTRIGHEETRRLLLGDNDPARPAYEETLQDRRTLGIGGERIELARYEANHSPDNIRSTLAGRR
jgi:hypothetical protein